MLPLAFFAISFCILENCMCRRRTSPSATGGWRMTLACGSCCWLSGPTKQVQHACQGFERGPVGFVW
jgi:hypothetical protein